MNYSASVHTSVHAKIFAPIDLIWEFIIESSSEAVTCPISGLEGGDVIQEYADGLLREVVFNGSHLKQRVFLDDAAYTFKADFVGAGEAGHIVNRLKKSKPEDATEALHVTLMHIDCEWQSNIAKQHELDQFDSILEKRIAHFKILAESTWSERG